jgi:hypothetical protein
VQVKRRLDRESTKNGDFPHPYRHRTMERDVHFAATMHGYSPISLDALQDELKSINLL